MEPDLSFCMAHFLSATDTIFLMTVCSSAQLLNKFLSPQPLDATMARPMGGQGETIRVQNIVVAYKGHGLGPRPKVIPPMELPKGIVND